MRRSRATLFLFCVSVIERASRAVTIVRAVLWILRVSTTEHWSRDCKASRLMRDREPILPPRPPVRIALWAAANARWFGLVDAWSRLLAAAVRFRRRAFSAREETRLAALASV